MLRLGAEAGQFSLDAQLAALRAQVPRTDGSMALMVEVPNEGFEPMLASLVALNEAILKSQGSQVRVLGLEQARPQFMFRCEGDFWKITWSGHDLPPVRRSKGLSQTAFMLARVHQEFSPLVVEAHSEPDRMAGRASAGMGRLSKLELGPRAAQRGIATIDPQDLDHMRAQIARLDRKIVEARDQGNARAEERYLHDRNALYLEVLQTTNRWGNPRLKGSDAERAANNVTRNVTRAIERLKVHDKDLARHLDRYVTRNSTCSYHPPDPAPPWMF